MYVQDVLKKQLSEEVWEALIQKSGHVYVCGSMNMARDVAHAIQEILVNRLGITLTRAGDFLDQLKVSSHYIMADCRSMISLTSVIPSAKLYHLLVNVMMMLLF